MMASIAKIAALCYTYFRIADQDLKPAGFNGFNWNSIVFNGSYNGGSLVSTDNELGSIRGMLS